MLFFIMADIPRENGKPFIFSARGDTIHALKRNKMEQNLFVDFTGGTFKNYSDLDAARDLDFLIWSEANKRLNN